MWTIVIVEDQPVLARAYRNRFRGEGFNVKVALDGEEGLDLRTSSQAEHASRLKIQAELRKN
jgi:DNA-binding response OmpR family regulator